MESHTSHTTPAVRLLASTEQLANIVPALHARAAEATGATRTVLLELESGTDRLRPTSGTGIDALDGGLWLTEPAEAALVADVLATGRIRQVGRLSEHSPDLSRRLETPAAILAPVLYAGQPLGLLVLGVPAILPALEWSDRVAECADALAVALARARMGRDAALRDEVHGLIVTLGRSPAPGAPGDRLEEFCVDVARLFAADRVALWQHNRQARQLERVASSDAGSRGQTASVSTADAESLIAAALRHQRAGFVGGAKGGDSGSGTIAAVPLRGRRRALGTLLLEGIRVSPGDEAHTLERLDGLGHQLANVLESAQLLDDVLRTRRELERTFDSMQDVVVVRDRHGRVTHANEAAARRFGRSRPDLIGRPLTGLIGAPLAAWLAGADDTAGRGVSGETLTTEVDDAVLGGTQQITLTPLADDAGSAVGSVLVARNVSDERRLEAERASLRERLAQSEAMSHLVAGIAHELNNPLQAVLGHLELVRRTHRLSPAMTAALRPVYRESDRAARIVRNLLVLAGSGHLARRPVSVNAALRRALALRAPACRGAGIKTVRHLADGLPRVAGDGLLLQQAFLNILLNAEQALGESGGRIEVRTSYVSARREVVVEIRDSGPGIPADVLPRVFDPFFTTKDAGSGLGLAMTQRIIREHGGDISAANSPKGGSAFCVQLPPIPAA